MSAFDGDEAWARDRRHIRWQALREDGPLFGLTPSEAAEFARLDREFAEQPEGPQ